MTDEPTTNTGPHPWAPKGWRYWICRHCYGPKSLHPRTGWVRSRPVHDNQYLSANAPHFNEGW
ncbi:hypothetical protein OHB14_36560 [Streptomyces sp. NBC_01613]|uniref:hypothetical protein n=1 Tax=Streptomyces sp. NBC_01613 TaxID=2975896 RepID=UPI00386AA2A5